MKTHLKYKQTRKLRKVRWDIRNDSIHYRKSMDLCKRENLDLVSQPG